MMMKKFIGAVLCCFFAAGLCGSEDNLLNDPGFTLKNKSRWNGVKDGSSQNGVLKVPLNKKTRSGRNHYASVTQNIPSITPEKYDFSGYYRGDFNALYVVFRTYNKAKKQKNVIVKYLLKKNFVKAGDKPSWNKFFFTGVVPADAVRASVHIEAIGHKGNFMELTNIELMESEE